MKIAKCCVRRGNLNSLWEAIGILNKLSEDIFKKGFQRAHKTLPWNFFYYYSYFTSYDTVVCVPGCLFLTPTDVSTYSFTHTDLHTDSHPEQLSKNPQSLSNWSVPFKHMRLVWSISMHLWVSWVSSDLPKRLEPTCVFISYRFANPDIYASILRS